MPLRAQGITDLITLPGLINTDFADVRMIMSNAARADGVGWPGDGAVNAARTAISSPMLEASVEGARYALNVSGPSDLGLFEVNEAAEIWPWLRIRRQHHLRCGDDDSLGDEVRITVTAGFDWFEGERKLRLRSGSTTTSTWGRRHRLLDRRLDRRDDADDQFDVPEFLS